LSLSMENTYGLLFPCDGLMQYILVSSVVVVRSSTDQLDA
jgi:hypothetical protein